MRIAAAVQSARQAVDLSPLAVPGPWAGFRQRRGHGRACDQGGREAWRSGLSRWSTYASVSLEFLVLKVIRSREWPWAVDSLVGIGCKTWSMNAGRVSRLCEESVREITPPAFAAGRVCLTSVKVRQSGPLVMG